MVEESGYFGEIWEQLERFDHDAMRYALDCRIRRPCLLSSAGEGI
jgi:hypothetical protein